MAKRVPDRKNFEFQLGIDQRIGANKVQTQSVESPPTMAPAIARPLPP